MKRNAAWMGCIALAALAVAAEGTRPKGAENKGQQEQLAAVQGLVGTWRGVGQPQRGSSKGSWIERADCAWKFAEAGPSLVFNVQRGKYFSAAELRAAKEKDAFELTAKTADGATEAIYRGQRDKEGNLVLVAQMPPAGMPARVSLRLIAGGNRLVMLLERAGASSNSFARLAEIGYTRQGSGFGKGESGPECVVTGGFGSIEVSHNGQKYFVCCTGCRDYFIENPEEVLAEYKARKEAEKQKATDDQSR